MSIEESQLREKIKKNRFWRIRFIFWFTNSICFYRLLFLAGDPRGPHLAKTNKIQKLSDKWKTIFVEFWISKPSAELKAKCNKGIISFLKYFKLSIENFFIFYNFADFITKHFLNKYLTFCLILLFTSNGWFMKSKAEFWRGLLQLSFRCVCERNLLKRKLNCS